MNHPPGAVLDVDPLARRSGDGRAKTVYSLDEDVHQVVSEVQDRQHMLAAVAVNLPFGLDRFLDRPVSYFTFLREPVSRCVSYWYFAFHTRHRTPLWSALERYDFDLQRVYAHSAAYELSNDQVRMVSGSSAPDPGEDELRQAQETIEERFLLAGAMEHFDPCLRMLAARLDWHNTSYVRKNVGTKTDRACLPADAERRFLEANEWDIRLYEWLLRAYLPRKLA
jgi:hypothetical protein